MAGDPRQRVALFLVLAFGATAFLVLALRSHDAYLRVESWHEPLLAAAAEAGLEDPFLLAGLVYAESRGEPSAVSSEGALGLGQLLPSTAAELARRHRVDGPPYSPEDNLRLAAHYLAELHEMFSGDSDLAVLAYRMGPTAVARRVEAAGSGEAWLRALRRRKPSTWMYRTQVVRAAERFRERSDRGIAWRDARPDPSVGAASR